MISPCRRGFTLIELLVATAVVGVLVGSLLPAIQAARAAARRGTCGNQLRQLALAAHGYHTAHRTFPPGLDQKQVAWSPQYRGNSLFTFLLPYLEEGHLLSDWNYEFPLQNTLGGSDAPAAAVLPGLLCPADFLPANPVVVAGRSYGMTSYGGNGGTRSSHPEHATADGIFHTTGPASEPWPDQEPVTLAMITDGTSRTTLFGERSHEDPNYETFAAAYWADSIIYLGRWAAIGGRKRIADVTMSAFAPMNYRLSFAFANREQAVPPLVSRLAFAEYEDLRTSAFGSSHPALANFAFADGSVRPLHETLDPAALKALCTRAGQEIIVD